MTVKISNPKATFFHIPKCAGSSIRKWLTDNVQGAVSGKSPHKVYDDLSSGGDLGIVFCCVRNPYERAVSAYHYKLNKNRDTFKKKYRNFEEYVEDIEDKSKIPQYEYGKKADIILRYETLNSDFVQIQQLFNCHVPLPHKNKSKHDQWQSYYTPRIRDIVYRRFEIDFKMFDYPVNIDDYKD